MNEENKCVMCGHKSWKHVVVSQDVTWKRIGWTVMCTEVKKGNRCSCGAVAWTYG